MFDGSGDFDLINALKAMDENRVANILAANIPGIMIIITCIICMALKVLVMKFKAVHHLGLSYLNSLLQLKQSTRCLRSAADHVILTIPPSKAQSYGGRGFSIAAPKLWNKLSLAIRSADSLSLFKRSLKTPLSSSLL